MKDVCTPGYSRRIRNVPEAVKKKVYAEYGITHHAPRAYEVDHLISLELGGSNSIKNLWPESYITTPWNAHVKDALENELHKEVCDGALPLSAAQHEIAADWIVAYRKHLHRDTPVSTGGSAEGKGPLRTAGAASANRVWVNTRSHKYFLSGSRFYGKTKKGRYMTEAAAKAAGNIAARTEGR
jgi:hypothetical protein